MGTYTKELKIEGSVISSAVTIVGVLTKYKIGTSFQRGLVPIIDAKTQIADKLVLKIYDFSCATGEEGFESIEPSTTSSFAYVLLRGMTMKNKASLSQD